MGKILSMIVMRPVTFFILLTFAMLLVPGVVIPIWYNLTKEVEREVDMEAINARYEIITKVEDVAKLIPPTNSSAIELASILDHHISSEKLIFSDIQKKVTPTLFEAQSIIPNTVQVSYIGLDGLFFSYLKEGDQTYAIYSNSTFANEDDHYTWYAQLVNSNSGELQGEANITKPLIVVNEPWFKQAMDSPNAYASLGSRWSTNEDEVSSIFLDTAKIGGTGAVSLGSPVQDLRDLLSSTNLMGATLYMATLSDGKVLMEGLKTANIQIKDGKKALVQGSNKAYLGEIPCEQPINGARGITLHVGGADYIFYCSSIDIAMVPMVYVLAFPSNNGLVSKVHDHTKMALWLLIVMMVLTVISVFAFVALIVSQARNEVHLCSAYMRETEKTKQAEKKSMKQCLAFARANHDVRGYLACIKGLTDLSSSDVTPSSEVDSNLRKINECAEDLLGLVNSILDFSKIEAGEMQLVESEFNLAQLLEDIADLHHPVAMQKGVDVILELADSSIISKFPQVTGDRGKLKQILGNLLSNAVKFTSEGHICIKCHAKKPRLENSIIASNSRSNLLNRFSSLFDKNKRAYNDLEEMKTIKQDPCCVEFEFQVEDTGPGIPTDKRGMIFDNFVQVEENSAGKVGTGLGLGIVQSLVRLMGGDIEIVDKSNGEQGACFRFNIFLIVKEELLDNSPVQDVTEHRDVNSSFVRGPKGEKSSVILLIKNDARREMVQRYMESLGIDLEVLSHWEQLTQTLKRIKSKLIDPNSSSRMSPTRRTYSTRSCIGGKRLLPLTAMDGSNEGSSAFKRSNTHGTVKCTLLVIDCNAGDDFQKLRRSISEFRKDLYMICTKVVWIDRPDTRRAHFQGLQDDTLPSTDHIITEPLHGSRLLRIVRLLPDFGGDTYGRSKRSNTSINAILPTNTQSELSESSGGEIKPAKKKRTINYNTRRDKYALEQEISQILRSSTELTQKEEIQEAPSSSSSKEIKKVLIVDDIKMNRHIVKRILSRLSAEIETCECSNGKEALEEVCQALSKLSSGKSSKLPYDCIFMDCEMPVMDGYEATRKIREEEKKYGIHIPIIALSAHEMDGIEGKKITEAGMDSHLPKAPNIEALQKLNLF